MFVFLKALCARLFTSAAQIVERAQTVFRHLNIFNNYSTRARWISNVIIQQIVTMPIYGKEALNICHPT